jgi:hypothetical protein
VSDALSTWRRKLEFLQREEARASDPAQKFTLAEEIEEAIAKITQLESAESNSTSPSWSFKVDISRIIKYAPAEMIGRAR